MGQLGGEHALCELLLQQPGQAPLVADVALDDSACLSPRFFSIPISQSVRTLPAAALAFLQLAQRIRVNDARIDAKGRHADALALRAMQRITVQERRGLREAICLGINDSTR
jgi:hypothetical protein